MTTMTVQRLCDELAKSPPDYVVVVGPLLAEGGEATRPVQAVLRDHDRQCVQLDLRQDMTGGRAHE